MSRPVAQLFVTCMVNELKPQVGFAVQKVLASVGWDMAVPRAQVCCAQPAFNAGYWEEARAVGRTALKAFTGTQGPVVVPSGSCADMLVHHLPGLFEDGTPDKTEALALASRVRELSQFLVDDLGLQSWPGRWQGRVAYHPSCHLQRGLGVVEQPIKLLGSLKGLSLLPFAGQQDCCGFGGAFSVTHDALSGAMLADKLKAVDAVTPDALVSCDLGCLTHLEGGWAKRGGRAPRVLHLAELLAEALV